MTLYQFKKLVTESTDEFCKYGLSEPYAWRGRGECVAFTVLYKETKRIDVLDTIESAYSSFRGYRGGVYDYGGNTEVRFEYAPDSYTNGYCCKEIIKEIEDELYESLEHKMAILTFTNK